LSSLFQPHFSLQLTACLHPALPRLYPKVAVPSADTAAPGELCGHIRSHISIQNEASHNP
uniref:Uncharacterized protein n=1 Tax=Cairina moschata TaxID=8855 RepID=A0A8C3BJI6_CAIMO